MVVTIIVLVVVIVVAVIVSALLIIQLYSWIIVEAIQSNYLVQQYNRIAVPVTQTSSV